ncbi:MAG TPA: glutamyl-tRNA reductase [Gemmatimonadetes bacterium]|nr:glutamyl-tRNA reductase [Gemmatimonadota bacterium]|tara:strand:+ start:41944 stop:43212 length:1269 start_codon:yes stop_codon:yes gene_type:complete
MALALVGLSYRTAPVEVRERLAFPGEEAQQALDALRKVGVEEVVILATCNRTEFYLNLDSDAALDQVESILAESAGPLPRPLQRYLYRCTGDEVAPHLFRVTAGLDSMVLGEAEVQGQVRAAYQRSAETEPTMTDAVLNRLFQTALSVGGRVRSETSLGEGTVSVASVAVGLARKIFGDLDDRQILVLGAGDTSERVVAALGREGVDGVIVANRTYDRALDLAGRLNGRAVRWEEINSALAECDIVLTSTSAPHPLITRAMIAEAYPRDLSRALLMVDIAIPRDVEPEVGTLPNVFLYNVDDLQKMLDETLDRRRSAAVPAEALVLGEAQAFTSWQRSLAVVPAIRGMRERGERVRAREMERLLQRFSHLEAADHEALEAFSRRLLNQLLHDPTAQLREAAEEGRVEEMVEVVKFLSDPDYR